MNRGYDRLYDFECAVCGKKICILDPQQWVYKRHYGSRAEKCKTYYCCSWSCLKQMPEKAVKGKRSGVKDKVQKLLRDGVPDKEIMRTVGVTSAVVRYWKARL